MQNDREKQTAMSILASSLPRSDQSNMPPLAEYEKIDGFHDKPRGADQMLIDMRQEAKEAGAAVKNTKVVDELQAIEKKKRMDEVGEVG